jgi:5-methylcytosine-specific restriction enzyme subunit McrC
LDSKGKVKKYGISKSDMYQLYAYGHKYLSGTEQKELMIIYPSTNAFDSPLPDFIYEDGFRLRAVPFDLTTNQIKR